MPKMNKLPITSRGSTIKIWLPGKDALIAAMQFATPEAAIYLREQYERRLKEAGVNIKSDEVQAVLKVLDDFKDNVVAQRSRSSDASWSGKPVLTDFMNLQRNLSEEAITDIADKVLDTEIQMDFAIHDDDSRLVRHYSVGGEEITPDMVGSFDNLFNAWLARHNLISKDGVIYEGTEENDGNIKQSAAGTLVKAKAEDVRKLIEDKDEGFQQYMQEMNKEIQLAIEQRQFPAEPVEVEEPKVTEVPDKVVSKAKAKTKAAQTKVKEEAEKEIKEEIKEEEGRVKPQ